MIVHNKHTEPWKITIVDTGLNTMTGGRIKRIKDYVDGEPFLMTYGETMLHRVQETALEELHSAVEITPEPLAILCIQPGGANGPML